jgi:hypothetical protein
VRPGGVAVFMGAAVTGSRAMDGLLIAGAFINPGQARA